MMRQSQSPRKQDSIEPNRAVQGGRGPSTLSHIDIWLKVLSGVALAIVVSVGPVRFVFAQECSHYLNASDGDDSNTGARNAPLQSFTSAFQNLPSGSRVCVAAGEYFLGRDSDGVAFTAGGKSIDFELESFGGADEVVLSEKEFLMDVGAGRVSFHTGSASKLILGVGRANNPSTAPSLRNSLSTIRLISGTLDLSGVDASIEESVGNPGFTYPGNPPGTPAPGARVEFVEGVLLGEPSWLAAPRRVLIIGPSMDREYAGPVDLGAGTLAITSRGSLAFPNQISLESKIEISQLANDSVDFRQGIRFLQPGAPSDTLLAISGAGTVTISSMVLSGVDPGQGAVVLGGSSTTTIGSLLNPDNRPTSLTLDVDAAAFLGSSAGSAPLGTVIVRGILTLAGPVQLAGPPSAGTFVNSGTVDLSTFDLTLPGGLSETVNSGAILSQGGNLILSGATTMSGDGALPGIVVRAPSVLSAATIGGHVTSFPGGTLTLLAPNVQILGNVDAADSLDLTGIVSGRVSGSMTLRSTLVELQDGSLLVEGDLALENATIRGTGGLLTLEGPGTRSLLSTQSSVPGLSLGGGAVRFEGSLSVDEQLNIRSSMSTDPGALLAIAGAMTMADGASLEIGANSSVSASSLVQGDAPLTLGTQVEVRIGGDMTTRTGPIAMEPGSRLRLEGDVSISGGALDLSDGTIEFDGGTQTFTTSGLAIGALTIPAQFTQVTLHGVLSVKQDLVLTSGALELAQGAVLTLQGNLSAFPGRFSHNPGSSVAFSGSGARTLLGASLSLPSVSIDGPSINLAGNFGIAGDLTLQQGSLAVGSGSTLSVAGDVRLRDGQLSVGASSTLDTSSLLEVTGGRLALEGHWDARGDVHLDSGTPTFSGGSINLAALSTQEVILPDSTFLVSLTVETPSATLIQRGPKRALAVEFLSIGALSEVSSSTVRLYPGLSLILDGRALSSGSASLVLESPTLAVQGQGLVEGLTLALPARTDTLHLESQAQLELGGTITLSQGVLDVRNSGVFFAGSVPELRIVLTDAEGVTVSSGAIDATGSPPLGQFDLTYSGTARSFYDPAQAFGIGSVRTFKTFAADAINSPPVFGLSFPDVVQLAGGLEIGEGALIRLGQVLTISSNDAKISLSGRLTGAGDLRVNGGRLVLADGAGLVPFLIKSGAADLSIEGSGRVQGMQFEDGTVLITSPSLELADSLIVAGSSVSLQGLISGARQVRVLSGALTMGAGSHIIMPDGANFESPGQVNLGTTTSQDGFVEFSGSGTLTASRVPRLRIVSESPFSSVALGSDITIDDRFDQHGGVLALNGHSLTVKNKWTVSGGSSNMPPRILGSAQSPEAQVALDFGVQVSMAKTLELASAPLTITQGSGNTTTFSADQEEVQLSVRNAPLSVSRGLVALRGVDLVAEGRATPLVSLTDVSIPGDGSPRQVRAPSKHFDGKFAPPLSDSDYSELVVRGIGNDMFSIAGAVSIDNLRLENTVLLESGTSTLDLNVRLVLGQNDASLISDSDGLLLGAGAAVVRRGRGSLTTRPAFAGAVDVYYDLGDGTLTGHDSNFHSGFILTGPELDGDVRDMMLFAGSTDSSPNTITLAGDMSLSGRLIHVSGILDLGNSSVRALDGATVALYGIDPSAPPRVEASSGAVQTPGQINLVFSSAESSLFTDDHVFPPSLRVDTMFVDLGGIGGTGSFDLSLHANRDVAVLDVANDHAGATLNLNGRVLTTLGDTFIRGGGIRSSAFADFRVGGDLSVAAGTFLSGAIQTSVGGDGHIDGSYRGLALRSEGDLSISGELAPSASLTFRGHSQTLSLSQPLTVRELIMEQIEPGSTLELACSGECPASLTIAASLVLREGTLNVGGGSVALTGPGQGYSHQVNPGSLSHVLGKVLRSEQTGSTGPLDFPTGTEMEYLPVRLTFPDGLLADATLSAQAAGPGSPAPGVLGGLVDRSGFASLPAWVLTSSIDFGRSQRMGFTGITPEGTTRLAYQSPDSPYVDWRFADGDYSPEANLDGLSGLLLEQSLGLLTPTGARIAAVTTGGVLPTTRATLILINTEQRALSIAAGGVTIREQLQLGDRAVSATLGPPSAEAAVEFPEVTVRSPTSSLSRGFTIPGGSLLGAAVVWSEGSLAIVESHPVPLQASSSNGLGVVVFNNTDAPVTVRSGGSEKVAELGARFWSDHTEINPRLPFLEIEGSGSIDLYRFDFSEVTGETVLMVVSPGTETALSAQAVDQLGGVIDGVVITSTASDTPIPLQFALQGNYPNPFNPATTILFDLPHRATVTLRVFDVLGRMVRTINAGQMSAGSGLSLRFEGEGLASGLYLYRLEMDSELSQQALTGRFLLAK